MIEWGFRMISEPTDGILGGGGQCLPQSLLLLSEVCSEHRGIPQPEQTSPRWE